MSSSTAAADPTTIRETTNSKTSPPAIQEWSPIIQAIGAATGTDPSVCLAESAAVLGGIAGPIGSVRGHRCECFPVGQPLVVTGAETRFRLFHSALIEPALRQQDLNRLRSRSCHPKALEQAELEHPNLNRHWQESMENLSGLISVRFDDRDSGGIEGAAGARRRLQTLRRPSFILTDPSPENFARLTEDLLDSFALVYDPKGHLIERVNQGRKGATEWARILDKMEHQQGSGQDQSVPAAPGDGPGLLARVQTPYLGYLPSDSLAKGLNHGAASSLLKSCLILPLERVHWSVNHEALRYWVSRLNQIVANLIAWRRSGHSVSTSMEQAAPATIERIERFEDRLDSLPAHIRPYCVGLFGLPQRLFWAHVVLIGAEEHRKAPQRYHSPVTAAAEWCLDLHVRTIRAALEAERGIQLQRQLEGTLSRFEQHGPLSMRDLSRKFTDQRRSTHEPNVRLLEQAGCLRAMQDGRLERVPGTKLPAITELLSLVEALNLPAFNAQYN